MTKKQSLTAILVLTLTLMITVINRHHSLVFWNYLHGAESVTATPDAAYFVKEAQRAKQGQSSQIDTQRMWPENQLLLEKKKALELDSHQFSAIYLFKTNLNALTMSWVSTDDSVKSLIWAGNSLLPLWMGFAALAIGLMVWLGQKSLSPWFILLGYFCVTTPATYSRTSAGFLDTDSLNIFFHFAICACLYGYSLLQRSNERQLWIIPIVAAGILNFFFNWWYQHPGFTVPYSLVIIVIAWMTHESKFKGIGRDLGIFLLFSGPLNWWGPIQNLWGFVQGYLVNKATQAYEQNIVAGTLQTVGEVVQIPLASLGYMTFGMDNTQVATALLVMGLCGLILWLYRDPYRVLAYGPVLIFIPIAWYSGSRFLIFAAPLIWLGLLMFILEVCHGLLKYLKVWLRTESGLLKFVPQLLAGVTLIVIHAQYYPPSCMIQHEADCVGNYGISRFPATHWDKTTEFLNQQSAANQTTLALSWWDYGYHLNLATQAHTIHDNGGFGSIKTNMYADALLSKDQSTSYDIWWHLSRYPATALDKCPSNNLKACLHHTTEKKSHDYPTYLIIDIETLQKLSVIQQIATQESLRQTNKSIGIFRKRICLPGSPGFLNCDGREFNLNTGMAGDQHAVSRIVELKEGQIKSNREINSAGKSALLIFHDAKKEKEYIFIDESVYRTSAMQLYLGLADKKYFNLVFDDFPSIRVYRLR